MKRIILLTALFIIIFSAQANSEKLYPAKFSSFKSGAEAKIEACEAIKIDITDYVNMTSHCKTSADCTYIKGSPFIGCHLTVNKNFAEEISKTISAYHQICQDLTRAKCAPKPTEIICQNNKCVPK